MNKTEQKSRGDVRDFSSPCCRPILLTGSVDCELVVMCPRFEDIRCHLRNLGRLLMCLRRLVLFMRFGTSGDV